VTPIEQLVHISKETGITPTEHRVGTDGAPEVFEFSKPMPESVRNLGCEQGLYYNYWRAAEGIKEGFADSDRLQDIEFTAPLFSEPWFNFYRRLFKLRWNRWQDRRTVSKLKREWRKPGTATAHLDSELIGPRTGEYQRIEAASELVSEKVSEVAQVRGFKLYWSYGDSNGWRVIVAIPTESELTQSISNGAYADFALELIEIVRSVVALDDGFKFYMELDSEERVNAAEGWCFRVHGNAEPGREFVFDVRGNRVSNA
jgi:hypothetical protein